MAPMSQRLRMGLLFLRNADGGPLFDSFVHLLGGEQWPDRHASEPRGRPHQAATLRTSLLLSPARLAGLLFPRRSATKP
jgi:hypothetical protein